MLNQKAAGIAPRRRASVMCVFLLPKRCRRTFCYQIVITNDSKKPWDCREIGNPEQIISGPPVPLTSASQLTDEALELMKSKTLECIRHEEAGWYDGNTIESVDYLGRVCLIRKDETAPYDNECNIIYKINMVSRSGSSSVNFSYYYPVSFINLQVYPDNRCEVDLDSCIKPHFFRAIGLVFYGIETFNQLDREYITGKSYGWTMDSDVTLN